MLLLPVGGTSAVGPHLALGAETLLVERIAGACARQRDLLCAPALPYGVHLAPRARDGGISLRRKTLHRVVNELIDSWEDGAGIRHCVVLTAFACEPQLEALSTIRTEGADVTTVDVLELDDGGRLASTDHEGRAAEALTALLLHLAPEAVDLTRLGEASAEGPVAAARQRGAALATASLGEALFTRQLERILHLLDAIAERSTP